MRLRVTKEKQQTYEPKGRGRRNGRVIIPWYQTSPTSDEGLGRTDQPSPLTQKRWYSRKKGIPAYVNVLEVPRWIFVNKGHKQIETLICYEYSILHLISVLAQAWRSFSTLNCRKRWVFALQQTKSAICPFNGTQCGSSALLHPGGFTEVPLSSGAKNQAEEGIATWLYLKIWYFLYHGLFPLIWIFESIAFQYFSWFLRSLALP